MRCFVLLLALALAAPPSNACDLVNAYFGGFSGFEPCLIQEGDYITIGSVQQTGVELHDCGLDGTNYTRYGVAETSGCGGTSCSYPSWYIIGSNLSGNYHVETMTGNCVELCRCTAP